MEFDERFIEDLLLSYEGDLFLPDPEELGNFDTPTSCPPSPHLGATPAIDDVPDLLLDYPENAESQAALFERVQKLEEETKQLMLMI
ncbi:hypothetical protein TSTA_084440 [Talaromyces stipitatus ATCC 10500]|uniref:Uncharacterized protein n=1 Tax=Talaromyces stipitatus (strain ATCC 10500 / CBS 375.48 / QM 6759 / NRRL 1006) TaxID=441959 RepID=B8M0B6_TALSN|nr:uncharacterized protein TSTA_084440 [Talaromyces stipitatus ATCC 10500]EED21213.1 hypothetical protein TSTA_084440 [Talaromyces stipitatus ATCC 10500]